MRCYQWSIWQLSHLERKRQRWNIYTGFPATRATSSLFQRKTLHVCGKTMLNHIAKAWLLSSKVYCCCDLDGHRQRCARARARTHPSSQTQIPIISRFAVQACLESGLKQPKGGAKKKKKEKKIVKVCSDPSLILWAAGKQREMDGQVSALGYGYLVYGGPVARKNFSVFSTA